MVQRAQTFALVEQAAQRGARLRVAVLTLRNAPLGKLRAMGDAMDAALKALRRTVSWKSKVRGAKLAFEITGSEADGWHLHANVIIEGDYWHQAELAATWRAVSKGAGEVVWIEALQRKGQTLEDGVREAVKYFVKFREAEEKWTPDMKAEFEAWAHGRAFYRTYGSWRGALPEWTIEQEAAAATYQEGCRACGTVHGWEVHPDFPFVQWADLAAFGFGRGDGPVLARGDPPPPKPPGDLDGDFFEELQLARERPRRAKFECEADFEHERIEEGHAP